jgi:hypothetical protein
VLMSDCRGTTHIYNPIPMTYRTCRREWILRMEKQDLHDYVLPADT